MIEVGDKISTIVGGPYPVIKIENNNLIWFKIRNGVGQTIVSNVIEIIKKK